MTQSNSKGELFVSQPNILSLLDFCKGLAISLIFLFHYKGGWFGWQGVHIFIVLSGFGLTYSCLNKNKDISWKHWYLQKFERILPAYWLVTLAGVLVMTVLDIFGVVTTKNLLIKLLIDLSLLKFVSYKTLVAFPNPSLWFITLIISFYLIFPWLYIQLLKHNKIQNYILILLGAATSEFIYRAISIYWLDGYPIGYSDSGGFGIFPMSVIPLDRLPNNLLVTFQEQAPFGLFPSRIAEFILGMIMAIGLVQNRKTFHNIVFSFWMTVAGAFIWLIGNFLLYVGLWGWIFADFIIAIGLILWVVNLAWLFQQKFLWLFLKLKQVGSWSYYIFLTHYIFIYIFIKIREKFFMDNSSLSIKIFTFVTIITGTYITSWLLMKFDKSRFAKLFRRINMKIRTTVY